VSALLLAMDRWRRQTNRACLTRLDLRRGRRFGCVSPDQHNLRTGRITSSFTFLFPGAAGGQRQPCAHPSLPLLFFDVLIVAVWGVCSASIFCPSDPQHERLLADAIIFLLACPEPQTPCVCHCQAFDAARDGYLQTLHVPAEHLLARSARSPVQPDAPSHETYQVEDPLGEIRPWKLISLSMTGA